MTKQNYSTNLKGEFKYAGFYGISPMKYVQRWMEKRLLEVSEQFPALLLTGPRQVGKTTLLKHLCTPERKYVTLDDFVLRSLAREDPALFLQRFEVPVLIDEIQYAPELLPYLKMIVDERQVNNLVWMTGSQPFHAMQGVSESMAGRVAIINLFAFSRREKHGLDYPQETMNLSSRVPFTESSGIFHEKASAKSDLPVESDEMLTLNDVFTDIWKGFFPVLCTGEVKERDVFYSSYIQTYLERDVRELAQVGDGGTFFKFLRICAARTAQPVNLSKLARDADISVPTAKKYLSVLEMSYQIKLVPSYHNNRTKRAVKAPKMFFLDTGLCAYLTQWSSPETLATGAMNGAFFENYVYVELLKRYANNLKHPSFFYYRDRDKREIDLIIEQNGVIHPIEIKLGATPKKSWVRHFSALENIEKNVGHGFVICLSPHVVPLSRKVTVLNAGII